MHRTRQFIVAATFGLFFFGGASAQAASKDCPPLLDYRFNSLQGKPQDLCAYRGKVILVVNTASYCGYTEQYKGLQALHDKYRDQGLVVVGFPANNFGKQEPGSNADVADFCERTYKVKFPMMEKTSVVGAEANAFYLALSKATSAQPKWNFHKYLISADAKTVKSFASNVTPESASFQEAVVEALHAK